MKISTTGENKPDEVPILPRYVSDTNVDLQDQNLDEKNLEGITSQAKMAPAPQPQPAKIAMKKKVKVKKNSACQAVCDFFGCMIFSVLLILLIVSIGHLYESANSQVEHHNNLVRYVNHIKDTLVKNQGILFNTINDGMTKFNELGKDLQTLKDSVKHIEEQRHLSDDDIAILLDGVDHHNEDSDYPSYPSSEVYPDISSTTETTSGPREGYLEDNSDSF